MRWCAVILVVGMMASGAWAASDEGGSCCLPFGKAWCGDAQLPLPFGVGLTFYTQKQDYKLKSLELNPPLSLLMAMPLDMGVDLPAGAALPAPTALELKNKATDVDLQASAWVLPFLDVFALLGDVDGETKVAIGAPIGTLDIDYHGLVYGGGATLAGAWQALFGSMTYTYTQTYLDEEDSSVTAWQWAPRVGFQFQPPCGCVERLSLGTGATYQWAEEKHKGDVAVPVLGRVAYDVKLKDDKPWNYPATLAVDINKHWQATLEAGFGDRTDWAGTVTYRF